MRARLFLLLLVGCGRSDAAPPPVHIECAGSGPAQEWRTSGPLTGACNVDTEHHIFAQRACYHNSGVRRYASSNDAKAVEAECRAGLRALVDQFCARNPDQNAWQASWVAFKPDGAPAIGSESMYGTCRPFAIERDLWADEIMRL